MACDKDIAFSGKETAPVLVVECMACCDSTVEAIVSGSLFFLNAQNEFPEITNATVHLLVNGYAVETLNHAGYGHYLGTYRPHEGDTLQLQVSAPGYPSVNTETVVPYRTQLLSIDTTVTQTAVKPLIFTSWGVPTPDTVGTTFSLLHHFEIRFTNTPGKEEYYRLVVEVYNNASTYLWSGDSPTYLTDFNDLVFGTEKGSSGGGLSEETDRNPYNVFDDNLIDGKFHTLRFDYQQDFNHYFSSMGYVDSTYTPRIVVDLQAISRSYYLYLKTLDTYRHSDGIVTEKTQIYSNIVGGLGIMGTRTRQPHSFTLPTSTWPNR
jgi:hypothetical protein